MGNEFLYSGVKYTARGGKLGRCGSVARLNVLQAAVVLIITRKNMTEEQGAIGKINTVKERGNVRTIEDLSCHDPQCGSNSWRCW